MSTPALQKLLSWLSPAFPVGTFAWSAGLEQAIADNAVTDSEGLQNWIAGALAHGGIRTDALLLAAAHRRQTDPAALEELAALCLALAGGEERHAELQAVGAAFVAAARNWPSPVFDRLPDPCPYPVAVGAAAAAHHITLDDVLLGFLTAAVQAQISVALRAVPLGQSEGLRVLAALEPAVADLSAHAATATLADLGAIGYAADIAQMRHETLQPRLFRS